MKKRFISILLSVCMAWTLASALTITSFATSSATYYSAYGIWFDKNTGKITGCDKTAIEIDIPAEIDGYPVTTICEYAFSYCGNVTKITIPNGVTNIGFEAFKYCKSLVSITIPESVVIISWRAFMGCSNLRSVTLPQGINQIYEGTFKDCEKLSSINIPQNVTKINKNAFYNCTRIQNIELPPNLTFIGEFAFYNCKNITGKIIIPGGVSKIERGAFYGCSSIDSVSIENGVKSIGDSSFENCSGMYEVKISSSVENIQSEAFARCTLLKEINIPKNVSFIGGGAFAYGDLTKITVDGENQNYCEENSILYNKEKTKIIQFASEKYTSVVNVPEGVTIIGKGAFSQYQINEITIPYGVNTVDIYAFYNCDSLRKITIPKSVKSIGNYAFEYCNNLKDVYYTGSEEDWGKINIGYSNECLENATIHYGYKTTDKLIDDYIIKEVKKYTSDGDYAQFDSIISSSISYEEKLRRLNELFKNNGFTNAKEGIKYLSETTSYRSDYRYLTTNEIYCSYNFLYWLYNTKKGLAARSALYTSGLIFNYEVFDYMNLGTYAESEYPGVKKSKALLKKIMESNNDSTVCDVLDYSNKTAKFLKNLITLNGLEDKAELVEAVNKMKTYTTKAEFDKAVDVFCDKVAHYIEASVDADKVYLDASNFKEALNTSANIISFAGATTEDIVAMVHLNNDIETYKKHSKFLTYIYNNKDLSFEMRLAAYQILDDINNGYFNRVISIIGNCFELADGFIYTDKTKLQYALEGMGMSSEGSSLLNSAFKTIKLATYISNIVVDTGDFVKQVAYTQGYAELSTLYAMKLEEDKKAFLANQSAENAWEFFEDYTMLWNLRYQGEQQYLDMGKVKMYIFAKVPTFNYNQKVDVVSDTLEHLEKCKFTIADNVEIPKSVQYVKKAVVKCPVDVYVYNSDGEIIAVLKDGIESDLTNEYGRFAVMRESYSGEYSKIICQSTNDDLKIKMVAIGNGLVDYQSASVDSDETKEIDKLIVNTDDVIEVNNEKYIVDTNGDGNTDLEGDLLIKNDDEYIKAEKIELSYDDLTLLAGKSQTLGVKIYPQNTTNTGIEWISLNPSVAVVKNGVVIGVGEGSANIIARVCDSEEIEYEMTVNVIDKIENRLNGYNFNNGILTINTYSKNNTSERVSAVRYIGLYSSDNALKKIVSVPVSLESEKDESKDILINNYTYENGDYIKSFIWNSELYPFSISKKLLLELN